MVGDLDHAQQPITPDLIHAILHEKGFQLWKVMQMRLNTKRISRSA